MTLNATGRKYISELVKGYDKFRDEVGVNDIFATVSVKGSTEIDPIGTPLIWSDTDSAFNVFTANTDWAASTVTALEAVVKPTTQNGYEYVCITAGTTNDTEGEPTWPTVPGGTVTETDGVVWICREAYSYDGGSGLSNDAPICVTVGTGQGIGFNKEAVTLTSTAQSFTVIFKGNAALVDEGFAWGSIASADQTEFKAALAKFGIKVDDSATTVVPTFV